MKKETVKRILLSVGLTVSMFFIVICCTRDSGIDGNPVQEPNINFTFTRSGEWMSNMRLFTFYDDSGAARDEKFYKELYNITVVGNLLSTYADQGNWNLAMVSAPSGTTLLSPNQTYKMSELPLYRYAPTVDASGKSGDAAEITLANIKIPIVSGQKTQTSAQPVRNMAMVELIVSRTTPNFNTSSTSHIIRLHNVPSTISYTGALLPNKNTPDTLGTGVAPLRSKLQFRTNPVDPSYFYCDTVRFIIPAHRGSDFLATNPVDTTTLKMSVSLDLERTGGSHFTSTKEIPLVAKCNKILRVNITVNDGIEFATSVLPWDYLTIEETIGEKYSNWIYVKQGSNGSGQSWSDAAPTINDAIVKANKLIGASVTVNGILVAGGDSRIYSEGFSLPAGVKIYGGWEGKPGTELPSGSSNAPYTSTDRDLSKYKAVLSVGSGNVTLASANTVLDGFVVTGAASDNSSVVSVTNTSAWINAVEIKGNAITAGNVFTLNGGTATNVLVSDNGRGILLTNGGKLVNATIARNGAGSSCSGATMLNCIEWQNPGFSLSGTNTVQYCAFEGTNESMPAGTGNVPIYSTNTEWFTVNSVIPGPHFNMTSNTSRPFYSALNDRAPMLRRGDKAAFDSNSTAMPEGYKKDIDGNTRFHAGITGAMVTDMGCYEDGSGLEGFQLKWSTDRVYVSSKGGYVSEIPLMLPGNQITDIGVSWTVSVVGTLNNTNFTGPSTGSGTGVVVGRIGFANSGVTPTNDYTGSTERICGTLKISSNLGSYLPDATFEVWQTPGNSSKWTTGYVGSFHKNNERGARYISVSNSGAWSARILSGLDWIKIDANDKGFGTDITDPYEGTTPSGNYYKEVNEAWGGVVSGIGNIKFRVGMKNKNTTGTPRYGLIVVTRTSGVAMFFVRQGEEPDYLYRSVDSRPTYGSRSNLVKFSPYNVTDPQKRATTTGTDLGVNGGTFTDYPTKMGYYFKWNQTVGHLYGTATSLAAYSGVNNSWLTSREVCPQNYRQATHMEYINSIYYDVGDTQSGDVSPTGTTALRNFEWGAYADGWYDQLASDPVSSSIPYATESHAWVGSGTELAAKGTLMVSHYNYAAVFFPAGSVMATNGTLVTGNYYSGFALYFTSTFRSTSYGGTHIHFSNDHIGMNCTPPQLTRAVPVRCIKIE